MYILLQAINLLMLIWLYLVSYIIRKIVYYFFKEDYENPKWSMHWYMKHATRNVQKSVEGDGQRNGHNCITWGSISTTKCFKCM